MEDRVVLLHKKLSFSDLADTVLQTGRIVLPRNQVSCWLILHEIELVWVVTRGKRASLRERACCIKRDLSSEHIVAPKVRLVIYTLILTLIHVQMEVNAEQIINLANKGARYINHDNNKATYELVSAAFTLETGSKSPYSVCFY